ncbi:malto-oligosyltrehalose trehalohydrolase [Serinibacter arcticus]|uniref:Malto-oligosyltrehalose trehalohydrolase n=1 Tax=Serinibacter arcticus TaxID=1655435 RepID=A0A2U1ZS30_9MICO|nr:malto-oligosyltrehalose trehalohydrolase [Serinibacter arcticus]PWD49788.1 malto-oligosyltrehalose trehalohydrolase [Serinibacter arcticus]
MTGALRVWAPSVATAAVATEGSTTPLVAVGDGWWEGPALRHGQDYAFHLDGGDARPDPRSAWQPHGVHGASRWFDASEHPWSDGSWAGRDARGAVTYELHLGTFTPEGDLDAAITRLPHLVDLGVEMVELMPVAAFNGAHGWGYDGVALWAVHGPYGGPAALQRFVDAAHAHGLGVCLDVVYNHLGPSGNYLAEFGPYFTDTHHTPWGSAVNLDAPGSAEVRRFVIENALRWLRDFHVDALRLDAVHALADTSERHVLAELSDAVAALAHEVGRPLSLVAESDLNDAIMVTPTDRGGRGMTAQWDDDVHHALHAMLEREQHGYYVDFGDASTFAAAVRDVFVHNGTFSTFRGEDWGSPVPDDVDPEAFVVFSTNHDQVGNRAIGDRPGGRCGTAASDPAPLAAAAALVLCSPFTPMLFMGEEWAATSPFQFFTDHPEAELGAAVSEGRLREFGGHGWAEVYGEDVEVPDPQDHGTFERSRLRWEEIELPGHAAMLAWHRALIDLRRTEPALARGDRHLTTVTVDPQDDGWIALHRLAPDGTSPGIAVVVNLGDDTVLVPLDGAAPVLVWDEATEVGADGVRLPARSVAVVRTPVAA